MVNLKKLVDLRWILCLCPLASSAARVAIDYSKIELIKCKAYIYLQIIVSEAYFK